MPTRFAILGFGHHAVRRLIGGFRGSRESELVGLWRRDPQEAAANAKEFDIPTVFASATELCASPRVDAVFITSPDSLHCEDALLAMRHGKAVLCEKPLAKDARQAQQMLEVSQQLGVPFGVAQNFRFNRSVETIQQWIAEGLIGQPLLAQSQFAYLVAKSPRTWIYDTSLAVGGPIADVGVHSIDALRYILQTEMTSVATLATPPPTSGGVELTASLQLTCSNGVLAHVSVTGSTPYRTLLEVTGSEGLIRAENGLTVDFPVTVKYWREGKCLRQQTMSNADGYSRMLDTFSQSLRGEVVYPASGADGLKNQKILDAAYRSWHSGQREAIDLLG